MDHIHIVGSFLDIMWIGDSEIQIDDESPYVYACFNCVVKFGSLSYYLLVIQSYSKRCFFYINPFFTWSSCVILVISKEVVIMLMETLVSYVWFLIFAPS